MMGLKLGRCADGSDKREILRYGRTAPLRMTTDRMMAGPWMTPIRVC